MTPPSRRSTIYDVAARVGVSAKTVSRVINGSPHVTDATRRRVLEAARELGYEQNPAARSLRSGRDNAVGIVLESLTDNFFGGLASGIQQVNLDRNAVPTFLVTTERHPGRERQLVESLVSRQIGGMIIVPMEADQSYLDDLNDDVPVVFVDRYGTGVERDTVVIDDEGAAYEATAHLAASGHTRIALIGDLELVSSAGARERGYRRALENLGIPVDEKLIAHCPTQESAVLATGRVLGCENAATAIFSSNATASQAIVPYLHATSRTDVALVCFGDFPMASALVPGVTVIDQDPVELGEHAARLLFSRIEGTRTGPAETFVLPTRLVPRGSGELPPIPRD